MQLSSEQVAAVRRTGQDVCCVAGPGSGKTRVLVERFAWLVEQGADAASILAITFTDKAATEIKSRLVERFRGDPERRQAVESAPVSTIHGFCRGLLNEHAIAAGLDPAFSVLDARQADELEIAAMESVLDRFAADRRTEFAALAEAWPADDMAHALRGVYESLRMGGGARQALRTLPRFDPDAALAELQETVAEMVASSPPPRTDTQRRRLGNALEWLGRSAGTPALEWLRGFPLEGRTFKAGHPMQDGLARAKALLVAAVRVAVAAGYESERALAREALIEFEAEYARAKRQRGVLDFADLEEQALALLEARGDIRAATAERYEAILMDELQDTNPVQWRILDRVRRPGRFFAVGDVNQSIYGFRHAVPEQFVAYQQSVEAAGGALDRLEDNYRSRQGILAAVEAVTVRTPCAGVRPHELKPARPFPAPPGPQVELIRVEEGDEPLWIAHRLRELYGTHPLGAEARPARYSDMAVLARTTTQFDAIEAALGRYGIPCVLNRGRNFFDEPEIVDLTNWLRVLENPADEIALFALLRSPFFAIPDEDLMRGRLRGRMAPEWAREKIAAARRWRAEIPVSQTLARLIDECGYLDQARALARANVEKFFVLLDELDARTPGDLAGHLKQIDDLRAGGEETNAPALELGDAVRVMSIHGSKGLEFPIVALVSLGRGSRGFTDSISWTRQTGLGMRWRAADNGESVPDPALVAAGELTAAREREEEDRLLYVAMTRAEELLLLCWTHSTHARSPWPGMLERGLELTWPANFDEPLDTPLSSAVRRTGEPPVLEPASAETSGVQLREVDAGEPEASASPAVAVTALATFALCPRRYYLQTLVGWPRAEAAGSSGAVLGTEVHELLGGLRDSASDEAHELAAVFYSQRPGAPDGECRARRTRVRFHG